MQPNLSLLIRHTNLRGHDGVAAHFTVVGYLYEIVEFHALVYACTAHSCAVNRSVGAYLNIVVNLYIANLRYLVVNPVDRANPKPSAPITTPLCNIQLRPILQPWYTLTPGYRIVLSPMTALSPT